MSDSDFPSTLPSLVTTPHASHEPKGPSPISDAQHPPSSGNTGPAGSRLISWVSWVGEAALILLAIMVFKVVLYFFSVLTGHAILRSAHNEYSAPLSSSITLGVVGGAPLAFLLIVYHCHKTGVLGLLRLATAHRSQVFMIALSAPEGAVAGALGAAMLQHSSEPMLSINQAARAGALGGPLVFTCYLLFVLSTFLFCSGSKE